MAVRPVYIAGINEYLYREDVSFKFYGGFSASQKQKSIESLHASFLGKYPNSKILEISTKSTELLGVKLSAFNLPIRLNDGSVVPFECAFQSSKVFSSSGVQKGVLKMQPWEAKKYVSNFVNETVISFEFEGERYDNIPRTFFYNWLYIQALVVHSDLCEELSKYDAFTDIEFNPAKSVNCQAEAVSVYVSLLKSRKLEEALSNKDIFRKIVYGPLEDSSQLYFCFGDS